MTATQTTVLRCDTTVTRCTETVAALPRETDHELRRRAMRENGWRYSAPSGAAPADFCRWHA